jgi:CBS domain-containing protein
MRVRDIMSQPVVTCTPETPVAMAARRMRDADCGVLPVVHWDMTPAGIVTDRDICLALATSHRSAPNISIHEVMKSDVVTVDAGEPLASALLVMRDARVRRLPVLDERRRVVGVLSMDDVILRGLEAAAIGVDSVIFALRRICERRLAETDTEVACAGL